MNYHYNLQTFFNEVSSSFAKNIAIEYSDKKHSYKNLNEQSNCYINFFLKNSIKQGDVVAIANNKVFEDYAIMIACLKMGVIYVNLDVDNPKNRINDILQTCKPKIIVSSIKSNTILQNSKELGIEYHLYKNIDCYAKELQEKIDIDGDSIAYIMFTSGSTGKPKGVAITHQNIIHFINWSISRYKITPRDKFANISPMYFDNSVFDFFTSLFSGATLVPIKKKLLTLPIDLVDYINGMKCTIWFSVPSMLIYLTTMRVLDGVKLDSIRIFTFGGEGYPKSELEKLYKLYSSTAKFINVYGPTEGTCICSSYDITEKDFIDYKELPSLGQINPNFSYVILDKNENEGNKGELLILGPCIGVGYYNDEERSKENFILYSNKQHYKKKLYKTGDLVEKKKGLLYFKGRTDNQIKHMGYRIELEEIEYAINSIKNIDQVAVLYKREHNAFGKIIAYIATKKDLLDKDIKLELEKSLPSYMIPSQIKILDSLPKNQNGKIDKLKLNEL